MKNLTFITITLLLVGCASHESIILTTPAVSMTKYSLKKGQKVQKLNDVNGSFCATTFGKAGNYGMMDEAIKDAQNKSHADYLFNVVFTRNDNCVSVAGTAAKIVN